MQEPETPNTHNISTKRTIDTVSALQAILGSTWARRTAQHTASSRFPTFAVMLSPYRGVPDTGSVSLKRFSNFATFLDSSSSSCTLFSLTHEPQMNANTNIAQGEPSCQGPLRIERQSIVCL